MKRAKKKRRTYAIILILAVAFLIFIGLALYVQYKDKKEEPEDKKLSACVSNEDCVPSSCCHSRECVPKEVSPECRGVYCTMICEPGTLDCRQGYCACINNKCKVIIS